MKRKIFFTGKYKPVVDLAILILRLVSGSFLLTHGWGKMIKVINGPPYAFSDPIGLGVTMSLFLVVFAEVICAICVMLGFAVRLTTIPIIIAMGVAGLIANANNPFSSKELSLLYLTIFFVIALIGAGRFSIDRLLESRNRH